MAEKNRQIAVMSNRVSCRDGRPIGRKSLACVCICSLFDVGPPWSNGKARPLADVRPVRNGRVLYGSSKGSVTTESGPSQVSVTTESNTLQDFFTGRAGWVMGSPEALEAGRVIIPWRPEMRATDRSGAALCIPRGVGGGAMLTTPETCRRPVKGDQPVCVPTSD